MPIFSLPSPFGVGTLGRQAREFADFLAQAGQSYWQILPIGPTGYGDSPYQSFSSRAGNPYFIDLDELEKQGLLEREEYASLPWGDDPERVDYQALYRLRLPVLRLACDRLLSRRSAGFARFCRAHGAWLDDYALFMALKEQYGGAPWLEWPEDVRLRRPQALERAKRELKGEIRFWQGVQYLFFRQWHKFKTYVNEKGISIVGDLPIYVSRDSVEMWATPELFKIDAAGNPVSVAGTPPDQFSATGQYWGNPIYDWDGMESDGFSWWEGRICAALDMYDVIRLDHFRGFEAYWEVPFSSPDSSYGSWTQGPGLKFFKTLEEKLGTLPIIAEDLGFLTPGVIDMRDNSGFPGMKILQFAFEGTNSYYLPHNYIANTVAYVGTHDNETARGWFEGTATPRQREQAALYTHQQAGEPMADALNRAIAASVSDTCIYTMQDLLNLGNEARINTPATMGGNWTWRMLDGAITRELEHKLTDWTETYFRIPSEAEIELPQ